MSSEENDNGERVHFLNIVSTFRDYSKHAVRVFSHYAVQINKSDKQLAFLDSCSVVSLFAIEQLAANNRRRKDLLSLGFSDRRLLASTGYREKLEAVDEAILANQHFLDNIVADTEMFGQSEGPSGEGTADLESSS